MRGSFYDQFGNGQQLTKDFFAGILRLDVDQKPGNLLPPSHPAASAHYAVPADNPFVGIQSYLNQPLEASKLRSEFYAIGMRNPWRFAFDPLTGKLYSGDTGDHTRKKSMKSFPVAIMVGHIEREVFQVLPIMPLGTPIMALSIPSLSMVEKMAMISLA